MDGGEVLALRRVLGVVVELPHEVVEGHHRCRIVGSGSVGVEATHGHPTVVPETAVAPHLVVLCVPAPGSLGVRQAVRHAHAVDRLLRHPVHGVRRVDVDELEDRGEDVDDVVVLGAHLSDRDTSVRPAQDEPVGDAAGVSELLVPTERGVPRLGPAPGVVVVQAGTSELVEVREPVGRCCGRSLRNSPSSTLPSGPPSALAPLSESNRNRVESSVPVASR